jgi:hypothetical protein
MVLCVWGVYLHSHEKKSRFWSKKPEFAIGRFAKASETSFMDSGFHRGVVRKKQKTGRQERRHLLYFLICDNEHEVIRLHNIDTGGFYCYYLVVTDFYRRFRNFSVMAPLITVELQTTFASDCCKRFPGQNH